MLDCGCFACLLVIMIVSDVLGLACLGLLWVEMPGFLSIDFQGCLHVTFTMILRGCVCC